MRIAEIFYSLQGEGRLEGVPSVFVRTAGCNLACRWCDTPYALRRGDGAAMTPAEVMGQVVRWPVARHCVLTGGEPMLEPELPELAARLRRAGFHITIETNATLPPAGIACDLASLSPKLANAGPGTPPVDVVCLRQWMAAAGDYQIKLVCRGAEDLPEIRALLRRLAVAVPVERLLLMPEGATPAELAVRRETVMRICLEHGFRYAGRLQVELLGGGRGR
jgi:7-carboxy-7-deazaguanine synthase